MLTARSLLISASIGAASIVGVANARAVVPAAATVEPGRFVWRDLMTRDVGAATKFYGELFGWQFENVKRGGRPYVLARLNGAPVAGIVDVSSMPDAASQWLSFMSVSDVDRAVALVRAEHGEVLVEPRNMPIARVAVVTDPQGAPLGIGQLRRPVPDAVDPVPHHFFWQEYLARDAVQALAFYKQLAGYESVVRDSRLNVEYHVLQSTRGRAGLFRLPDAAVDVQPNWLPYLLVRDAAELAARVPDLGGRIVVPIAPERRNGSLVVIADPGGAVLALQKFPF